MPAFDGAPQLLPACERYWDAWGVLHGARLQNGRDPQALQLTEMRAAADHFGFVGWGDTFTFVGIMRRLDAEFLEHYWSQRKKEKTPPGARKR